MMKKETEIILDKLISENNFFKIVELSEIIDIDLKKYYNICPDININASDINYSDGDGYFAMNLQWIKKFRLKDDKKEYTDLKIFLQNIERVYYIEFTKSEFYVSSGEFYYGDSNFRSIEFKLHNANGYATISSYNRRSKKIEETKKYSLNGVIFSKKEYDKIIRKVKLSTLTDNPITIQNIIDIKREKILKLKEEKRKKKNSSTYNSYNIKYTGFDIDDKTILLA